MSSGTNTGRTPRTTASVSTEQKPAASTSDYRLRCPDCGFTKDFSDRGDAAAYQRRFPCPNCDRMLGLAEQPRGDTSDDLDAADALAAAEEERAQLARDGDAPSTEEILRVMGRDRDGYPLSTYANKRSAHEAAQILVSGSNYA